MVANAVLLPIHVVRVTRTKGLGDIAVIAAALILVAYQERDRGAGGAPLIYSGKNLDTIGFTAGINIAQSFSGSRSPT